MQSENFESLQYSLFQKPSPGIQISEFHTSSYWPYLRLLSYPQIGFQDHNTKLYQKYSNRESVFSAYSAFDSDYRASFPDLEHHDTLEYSQSEAPDSQRGSLIQFDANIQRVAQWVFERYSHSGIANNGHSLVETMKLCFTPGDLVQNTPQYADKFTVENNESGFNVVPIIDTDTHSDATPKILPLKTESEIASMGSAEFNTPVQFGGFGWLRLENAAKQAELLCGEMQEAQADLEISEQSYVSYESIQVYPGSYENAAEVVVDTLQATPDSSPRESDSLSFNAKKKLISDELDEIVRNETYDTPPHDQSLQIERKNIKCQCDACIIFQLIYFVMSLQVVVEAFHFQEIYQKYKYHFIQLSPKYFSAVDLLFRYKCNLNFCLVVAQNAILYILLCTSLGPAGECITQQLFFDASDKNPVITAIGSDSLILILICSQVLSISLLKMHSNPVLHRQS